MRLFLYFFLLVFSCQYTQAQLVLNEFSQGSSGSKEYIELVVTGTKTCTDSTADLRGWIIDDQNGWYSGLGTGISSGHFRFALIDNWAKIPYGSIILLYNSSDKNESILLPDDPTDANKDHVYIVPHLSTYIEVHNSQPFSPSSPTFSYPETGYTPADATDWPLRVGLNNALDAVIIVKPTLRNTAYFSITYGLQITEPYQTPTSSLSVPVSAGQNCYLSDENYQTATSWVVGSVPQNETPGASNTVANASWINTMRSLPPLIPVTKITACITQGQTYFFNGQNLITTGNYETVYSSSAQCDSIVQLYLVVSATKIQSFSGCGEVLFNGTNYTASTSVRDTIKSIITDCDSLYFITAIEVFSQPDLLITGNKILCKGSETTLTANASGAAIVWSTGDTTNSITVAPNSTTSYTAIASANNGCSDTSVVQIMVENFKLIVTASNNPVVGGAPVLIQTSSLLPYSIISWSPATFFTNQTAPSQTIKPTSNTKITVVATTAAGCKDTASLDLIIQINGLHIPTAFTPNGDGKNDAFRVLGNLKTIDLKVFNRWGKPVFKTNHTLQSWNGYYKGTRQPAGVYVYVVSAVLQDGTAVTKTGTVTLIY